MSSFHWRIVWLSLFLCLSSSLVLAQESIRLPEALSPEIGSLVSQGFVVPEAARPLVFGPEQPKAMESEQRGGMPGGGAKPAPPSDSAKSVAEDFFAQPALPVGASIGGPAQIERSAREKTEVELRKETQEGLLARLLSAGAALPLPERLNLFQQLLPEFQQRYLQTLTPKERESLLLATGEKDRWFLDDLKTETVDRNLRQFGYDFFANTGGGFVPEKLAPVGPDYVVGPGDTLVVTLWGTIDGSYEVTVDRSGNLQLPRVGSVYLWGQTFAEAREAIRKQFARYYTGFEVNVTMGALRSIQIYLVGEVNAPGTYTLSSLSTVLNALVAAGGPAKTGSLRQVQLLRAGKVVSAIDFYDFFLNGDRSRDARLQSGDTIHVPVVGPLVGVAGDVRRPAIYEIREGESLQTLLDMAGGVTSTAYLKKIQIERVEAHQKKVTVDLDLSTALQEGGAQNIALQDHDLLLVSPISPVRTSYVLLKGYAAHPGRYQFLDDMRLADLILPYNNLLPNYFPDMVEILRLQPPLLRPEKLTANLARALEGDPEANIALQEFDEIRLFAREEMEEIPQVIVSGGVLKPGAYRYYEKMTVRDLVTVAGNLRRGAYLAEAELSRHIPAGKETRIERILFDLEKALAGDPAQNLVLLPEDHLFVRTVPDYTERLAVEVRGRVLFPGTYSIAKGETLSSVLERAGGVAADAYLRGAVFTRESVRKIQQERMEKLIFEQERQITRASADIALGALSPEDLQTAQALLASRKAMLEKLKQVPVTGRLVIQLAPLDEFKGSVYDIPLMEGDVIAIPENPKAVTVLGQVYNPISLSYQSGKTASFYLESVGGPTKDANVDEMFIVRADGTVLSRSQGGMGFKWDSDSWRWIVGGFNTTELYPGDTLLVPEKVKRTDVMREIRDLTTIFYQMALGAAAVASF